MKIKSLLLIIFLLLSSATYAQNNVDTITANGGTVILNPNSSANSIHLTLTGTWTGTLAFEYLPFNSTSYAALTCTNETSFATATGATTNANWACLNINFTSVRVRATAFSSGTATISWRATSNNALTGLIFGGGSGGTIGTVNQGTASATEQWLVNCVTGCSGGTTDTDDGTVAAGQSTGLSIGLGYKYNGSAWVRQTGDATFGLDVDVTRLPTLTIDSITNPVTVSTHAVTQSGTWTVQPGNTANTTPWLVTGSGTAGTAATGVVTVQGIASGVAQPVTGTITAVTAITNALPSGTNVIGHVICDTGCSGSGGTSTADDADFTAGTTAGTIAQGVYESSPTSVTAGDVGAIGITATRAIRASLESAAGVPWVPSTDYTHDTTMGTITGVTGPANMFRASAAAPSDVSADGDAVLGWHLRNGSAVTNLAVGGTLITATSTSLNVACTTGCGGSGGASQADNSAVTDINASGFLYDTTIPTITDGNVGLAVMDSARRQIVAGAGTAGTPAGGIVTMQGAASMTPVLATLTGTNTVAAVTAITNALPAGTNNIGDVDVLTLPALVAGTANIGDVDVLTVPTDPFGANADAASATGSISAKLRFIAATGIPITGTVTVGSHAVTNAGTFVVQENGAALTSLQLLDDNQTGDTVLYRTSAGSTEDEHEVKATAGRLFSVAFTNTNAAARYWRCSNLTAANTTPGTSTVYIGLAIPGATSGAGFVHDFGPNGLAFSTALTCWWVTGAADSDVAEVAANEIKATYGFK